MASTINFFCPDCGTPLSVEVHIHSIQNPKDNEHMALVFAGASVRHKCPPRPTMAPPTPSHDGLGTV